MTSPDHQSGSDRLAEAAETLPVGSIIVNVQGDEPLISSETIDRAVNALSGSVDIVTVSEPITSLWDEILNFNVVKVVAAENGDALYFSRSPMPFPREAALRHGGPNEAIEAEPELLGIFRKHVGLYVYRREFLLEFTRMPQTRLERIEMLEQLRALENGARIKVVEAAGTSIGVDTAEEFERNAAEGTTALGASMNALQELMNPEAAKAKEVITQLKEGRYQKKKREGKAGGDENRDTGEE